MVPSASTQFPQSTSNIDATTISTVTSKRLFVQDQNSKLLFLIDTGSDISIVSARKQNLKEDDQCLFAANGSRIKSYGKRYFNLNIGLRRAFNYKFTIADTHNNIIGADFLASYHLCPDLTQRQLIDASTQFRRRLIEKECQQLSVSTINNNWDARVRELLRIPAQNNANKDETEHHLLTTDGNPVFTKPRRLSGERLQTLSL